MADKVIDVEIRTNTTGVKSLRQELRETVMQLQQLEVGTQEFERLNQKAAEIKDKMAEVNEQIAVMATGSKFEKVSNSLGEISAGLASMDFERATQGAKLFAQNAKEITFKDAIGSVKQLGSTFMTVGKAILTNPLFLLVGVIVLIAVAVYKLMEKLGIIKKIFEAVGAAIDFVVQALKDFLDWIGLTSFAAEDAAQKQADAAKKTTDAMQAKSAAVIQGFDQEIRMAELDGKNTEAITLKKL